MYKARKKSVGGDRGNQYTKVASAQNEHEPKGPNRTAEVIAKELGIGKETVKRSEKFHDGIDALREISPEAADKVMRGGSGAKKQDIISFPTKSPDERAKYASDVLSGNIKKKSTNHHSATKAERAEAQKTKAIIADMYDVGSVPEYTLEFLIEDIQMNGAKYVELLRNTLKDRHNLLTDENRPTIAEAIESIITQIKSIKELVTT